MELFITESLWRSNIFRFECTIFQENSFRNISAIFDRTTVNHSIPYFLFRGVWVVYYDSKFQSKGESQGVIN